MQIGVQHTFRGWVFTLDGKFPNDLFDQWGFPFYASEQQAREAAAEYVLQRERQGARGQG
jgi:hypothetical protein